MRRRGGPNTFWKFIFHTTIINGFPLGQIDYGTDELELCDASPKEPSAYMTTNRKFLVSIFPRLTIGVAIIEIWFYLYTVEVIGHPELSTCTSSHRLICSVVRSLVIYLEQRLLINFTLWLKLRSPLTSCKVVQGKCNSYSMSRFMSKMCFVLSTCDALKYQKCQKPVGCWKNKVNEYIILS